MPFSPESELRIAKIVPEVERRIRGRRQGDHRARWFNGKGGANFRYAELAEDLDPVATTSGAKFYFATWIPADGWGVDDSTPVSSLTDKLYDPLGIYRGRARGKYSSTHSDGSKCEIVSIGGEWVVQKMEPHALLITGAATADWTASTFTIDGVSIMQPIGGLITDQTPAVYNAGNITVHDVHDWDGSENDRVEAVWNEATDQWEAIQKDCG